MPRFRWASNSSDREPSTTLVPVELDMFYQDTFKAPLKDSYERLLVDALNGDALLFMREDEIDAAWRVVDPLLSLLAQRNRRLPELRGGNVGTGSGG